VQKFDRNIGFWEKRQFCTEKCRKSQKIVIITSTPEWANFAHEAICYFDQFL
jgi:hypothetical protein